MARPKTGSAKPSDDAIKVLVRNRRALHDYAIEDRLEAGIALTGSEVKSLRDEAWLVAVQINEYPWAHQQNHLPTRERKLLLHRREIGKLDVKLSQKGYSAVPLAIYLKNGRIKVEIGIGRGKKQYEKRETVKEAEAKREIDRALRRR